MRRAALRILAALGGSGAVAGFVIAILAYFNDARRYSSWGFYPTFVLRHTMQFYTPYLLAVALFIPVAYLLFSYALGNSNASNRGVFRAVADRVAWSLAVASAMSIGFCVLGIAAGVWRYKQLMRNCRLPLAVEWDPLSIWNVVTDSGGFLIATFAVFVIGLCVRYRLAQRADDKIELPQETPSDGTIRPRLISHSMVALIMRFVFRTVIVILIFWSASSIPQGATTGLEWRNLLSSYHRSDEIKPKLVNIRPVSMFLCPFCPRDTAQLQRFNEEKRVWERGSWNLICGGLAVARKATTPIEIKSGEERDIDVFWRPSVDDEDAPKHFVVAEDPKRFTSSESEKFRPLSGKYRFTQLYALEPWTWAHQPEVVYELVSPEFVIASE